MAKNNLNAVKNNETDSRGVGTGAGEGSLAAGGTTEAGAGASGGMSTKTELEQTVKVLTENLEQAKSNGSDDSAVMILFNRSSVFNKLKQFENALEDCNSILNIDKKNNKAIGRKIKTLCSLGRFTEAHQQAGNWLEEDSQNSHAKREYDRLSIIVAALHCEDMEDDSFNDDTNIGEVRMPPEGMESTGESSGTSNGTSSNHGNTTAPALPVAATSKATKGISHNILPGVEASESADDSLSDNCSSNTTNDQDVGASASENTDAFMTSNEERNGDYFCSYCGKYFASGTELKNHCETDAHKEKVTSDDGQEWNHRPPPRGLTGAEYTKCPRFFEDGTCRFGEKCSQAHSNEELTEWRKRFEYRCLRMQDAKDKNLQSNAYAEQITQQWMNAETPETVMTENLDGVNVHVSCDLLIPMNTKKGVNAWLFTITTKVCLKRCALLDDASRRHFHVSSITVGPKRSQKSQNIDKHCQEWTNSAFSATRSSNEKVYRIKVIFQTDIYGTFRQSVVFDFGSLPVLVRQMCVESTPVNEVDQVVKDLLVGQKQRWDLATLNVIPFEPKTVMLDESEQSLLERYPPPMAAKFQLNSEDGPLKRETYKERMHHLLYIEEMAQFSSIAKYNVKASLQLVDKFLLMPSSASTAKFAQGGELFAHMKLTSDLSEDTSEGRLVLQNVHTVYLAPFNNSNDKEDPGKVYEALVEEKGRKFIFLRISASCVSELGLVVDTEFQAQVQFYLNRLPLCEMHKAVDRLQRLELVFPDVSQPAVIPWNPQLLWKDQMSSRLNTKQKEAIVAITSKSSTSIPPIIIVGPYGTGKTFTLAQAALQLLGQEDTRILICTHSNSAADLYIKEYLDPYVKDGHEEARPLRVYYRHRWVQTIDLTVLEYCLTDVIPISGTVIRVPKKKKVPTATLR